MVEKTTAVEPKTFHVWQCQTCEEQYATDSKTQMAEHLLNAHGIDVKTTPMQRQSTMHLDGADHYENHYLLTIGEVTIIEASSGQRDKKGMMWWMT